MENDPSKEDLQQAGTKLAKPWFLTSLSEGKWFNFLLIALFILVLIYILLHWAVGCKSKFEYAQLDADQNQQINKIYFDADSNFNKIDRSIVTDSNLQKTKNNSKGDSTAIANQSFKNLLVIKYLVNEFDGKIDTPQLDSIRSYIALSTPLQSIGFLSKVKLKIYSCFWLSGASIYFEIIFWTWFGVICSLLFNMGQIARVSTADPLKRSTYFDSTEIPAQVAKFAYAPLATLIIVLGYHLLNDKTLTDISMGKAVIVFAFIGGYYSSRLIAFLDRFKDLLLPNSGKGDMPDTNQPLKNAVIIISPPIGIFPVPDVSETIVTLTSDLTKEIIKATNIDKTQPSYFIADYLKPGKYNVVAELKPQADASPLNPPSRSEQNIEIKTTDIIVSMQLA